MSQNGTPQAVQNLDPSSPPDPTGSTDSGKSGLDAGAYADAFDADAGAGAAGDGGAGEDLSAAGDDAAGDDTAELDAAAGEGASEDAPADKPATGTDTDPFELELAEYRVKADAPAAAGQRAPTPDASLAQQLADMEARLAARLAPAAAPGRDARSGATEPEDDPELAEAIANLPEEHRVLLTAMDRRNAARIARVEKSLEEERAAARQQAQARAYNEAVSTRDAAVEASSYVKRYPARREAFMRDVEAEVTYRRVLIQNSERPRAFTHADIQEAVRAVNARRMEAVADGYDAGRGRGTAAGAPPVKKAPPGVAPSGATTSQRAQQRQVTKQDQRREPPKSREDTLIERYTALGLN